MESEQRFACYNCKEELVFDVKIGRRDMCPGCQTYLHCCYNCRHWDKYAHNECRENQGEFIRDRAEGNFCLYFDFRPIDDGTRETEADLAKRRLEAAFGKSSKPGWSPPSAGQPKLSAEDEAKRRLEALFKKK